MKLSVLGYVIFVLFCVWLSVYRHFPDDTASQYIQHEISKFNSDLNVGIQGLKPVLPPGIKADTIEINLAGNSLLELKKFKIDCNLISIFKDVIQCPYKSSAKKGLLTGTVKFLKKRQGQIIIESQFEQLMFDNINFKKNLYDFTLAGTVNGQTIVEIDQQNIKTGKGNLSIKEAVFDPGTENFFVDKIFFSSVDLMFHLLEKGSIKVEKCNMKGKLLDIDSSGDIQLASLFENSRINLKVKVHLYPMFFMEAGNSIPVKASPGNANGSEFDLTITGTVQNPKVKML